jgi:hypothetical protein
MSDQELRRHLVQLLDGGEAHITFENAMEDFPVHQSGVRPGGSPHSAWELLEHLRIALDDIASFSRATKKAYVELKWPDGYWPKSPAPGNPGEWSRSVAAIQEDLAAFIKLIEDPASDLTAPFPWGSGQTLLREALLIADHNSYHLGQLMLVRRMLESGSAS